MRHLSFHSSHHFDFDFRDTPLGLLHLHRRFFMQALRANPTDPLQHQFGHSVRAAFASACAASSGFWSIYQVQPLLIRRFPIAWSNGFSAAVSPSPFLRQNPGLIAPFTLFLSWVIFGIGLSIFVRPPPGIGFYSLCWDH